MMKNQIFDLENGGLTYTQVNTIISWSNTKFSEQTNCIVNSKENDKFDLGVKGLNWMEILSSWLVSG